VQVAPQLGLAHAEAGGDAGQVPHRIDRGLHDADIAPRRNDVAVGANAAGLDRSADFRDIDVSAGDRDGRTDIVAAHEMITKRLADQMSPRVERDDLAGVAPLRMRSDAIDRRGVGQIWNMVGR
jgi:hypothetical protein